MNESCSYFEKQKEITTGLLPTASSVCITQNEILANLSSYTFKRYSTDGIVDNVQLNLKDDTRVKRQNLRNLSDRQGLSCNLNSYMTNSRAVAGVQENHFSSNFLLENNHHIVDNQFDMAHNNLIQNDHDELGNDINVNLTYNDEIDHIQILPIPTELLDIRSQQDQLSKRFSTLTLSQSDEMEIDLFHMLKASNAPLILFDRIINWVQRHSGEIKQNGTDHLMKREKFIQDLNSKMYGKEILMKPKVDYTVLSSGRSTNVVTFSMKEMILRMVMNKSLFSPQNLLLDPDNPCSLPNDSLYVGEVNSGTWTKEAVAKECSQPNHILMPLFHFIDRLNIDKYGKLIVEAVLTCCLWFNR